MKGMAKGLGVGCGTASRGTLALAYVIMSLAVAFALGLGWSLACTPVAYASIHPVSESAASADEGSQSDDVAAASAESEEIGDEDVPMSSGLGGSEPFSDVGTGIQWFVVAGIVAVVAFFSISTLRLNRNISKMRNRLR